MKPFIALALMGIVLALPAHADMTSGEAVRIIEKDTLRLSDLFSSLPRGQDFVIGRAPRPGHDLTLTSVELVRVAQAYGVSYTPPSDNPRLVLRREGVSISAEQMKSLLLTALHGRGLPSLADVDVTFTSPMDDMGFTVSPKTKLAVQTINYDPSTGLFDARFNLPSAPFVSGKIEHLIAVPIARAPLEKGALLNEAAIDVVKMKQSQIGTDHILSVTDLMNMATRRTIPAGRPILARDVEYPLSIHRGDKVTLIYRVGVMELSAQGRALQDARTGDRIKVANVDSNKNLQGTAGDSGQVIID